MEKFNRLLEAAYADMCNLNEAKTFDLKDIEKKIKKQEFREVSYDVEYNKFRDFESNAGFVESSRYLYWDTYGRWAYDAESDTFYSEYGETINTWLEQPFRKPR